MYQTRPVLGILVLAIMLASCGEESVPPQVGVDCIAFDTKIADCSDAFIAQYVGTERGAMANGDTMEAKTRSLNFAFGMVSSKGESLCKNDIVFHNLTLRSDTAWLERFNQCDTNASCDVWARCAAHAIGNPL